MWNVKSKETMTLSDLYKKINETNIYEDSMYDCTICALTECGQEIKLANNTCRDQESKEKAITRIPIILKNQAELPEVVTIKFYSIRKDYIGSIFSRIHKKTLWKLNVNIAGITKEQKEFIEETKKNSKQVEEKMDNFKIPNY